MELPKIQNAETSPAKPARAVRAYANIGKFLSAHGIKPTRQRVAIATQMYERDQRLSADALLEKVNLDPATTNVSKATIYNTLKIFVAQRILREVAIDPQKILSDTNTHDHHHVLDLDTGDIRDIDPIQVDLSDHTGIKKEEKIHGVDLIIKVRNSN